MKELVERAQSGDWDAVCSIVDRLRERIERMARYYASRSGEDARDLMQEAWLGILEALRDVDTNIGSPQQYLLKRAKWRMLDFLKWSKRRRHESLEEMMLPIPSAIPQQAVASVFSNQFVRQLSDKQRTLVRYLLAGDTWREAAEKLGCTSANVAYHIRQIQRAYLRWNGEEPLAIGNVRSID